MVISATQQAESFISFVILDFKQSIANCRYPLARYPNHFLCVIFILTGNWSGNRKVIDDNDIDNDIDLNFDDMN